MVGRDYEGKFRGSRVNAESVPRLPAWAARAVLADPRGIQYLLAWTNARGELIRAARLSRFAPNPDEPPFDAVEVKEPRTRRLILINYRAMPHSRGVATLLVCPECKRLRRFLYAEMWWACRTCSKLRYVSEGVYVPAWQRRCGWGGFPHEGPWDPLVFSSPSPVMVPIGAGRQGRFRLTLSPLSRVADPQRTCRPHVLCGLQRLSE